MHTYQLKDYQRKYVNSAKSFIKNDYIFEEQQIEIEKWIKAFKKYHWFTLSMFFLKQQSHWDKSWTNL